MENLCISIKLINHAERYVKRSRGLQFVCRSVLFFFTDSINYLFIYLFIFLSLRWPRGQQGLSFRILSWQKDFLFFRIWFFFFFFGDFG